jgi:hypothetical protein
MIMDERLEFADAVSVAAAAGTALIGDVIDLGSVHRDIGAGQPVYLVITVDTEIITAVRWELLSSSWFPMLRPRSLWTVLRPFISTPALS